MGVEIRRLLARRLVRGTGGLVLLAILTSGIVVFARSHRPDLSAQQAAEQRALVGRQEEVEACSRGEFGIPENDVPPGLTLAEFCDQVVVGPPSVGDPTFRLTALHDIFLGTGAMLIVLLAVLAASFVGAEWHAGTITTLLTWEPRRVRVFLAKLVTAAAFAFVAFLVVQAVIAAALLPAALVRGTTSGADAEWLRSIVGLELRAAAVAAMAATMSLALASLGRNTAAALGVGFGYFTVLEPLLRGLRPGWQPWFLFDNVATFLLAEPPELAGPGRSPTAAALVLAAYAGAVALVAVAAFRRRDVT
jgi:ABC-2 type transport system permease protein